MKIKEVVQDKWMMFQCTKCFNRFSIRKLLVNKDGILVCPIDKHPVKQLFGQQALDASAEVGD